MTRKQWVLIVLAALLGGFSLYLNSDWFSTGDIQISHRSRPPRMAFAGRRRVSTPEYSPVLFEFNRKVAVTELKVVVVEDWKTNKYPHLLWHMLASGKPVPTRGFYYGVTNLSGMKPALKGVTADPLVPGVTYRLFLEAGSLKAEHDFTALPPAGG
jgi:hypothetical protein